MLAVPGLCVLLGSDVQVRLGHEPIYTITMLMCGICAVQNI